MAVRTLDVSAEQTGERGSADGCDAEVSDDVIALAESSRGPDNEVEIEVEMEGRTVTTAAVLNGRGSGGQGRGKGRGIGIGRG